MILTSLLACAISFDGLQSERPDIVLIVIDDVGWPDVRRARTPTLDQFAAEGLTFERFYSQPNCSPTRYGLVYGQYGFRDRLGSYISPFNKLQPGIPHERLSIAELLKARGYASAAFGKWHLNSQKNGNPREAARVAGFDAWRAGTIGVLAPGDYRNWKRVDDGDDKKTTEYHTTAVTDAFLGWWAEERSAPRFAYVAFYAAHQPFHEPPRGLLPEEYPRPRNDRERFEAMITALDHELGRLLAAPGLADALVVIVSDNGTPKGVDPPPGHLSAGYKTTAYEGGIHVPLWVRGPGVARGTTRALVHCVDVPRTLAAAAGAQPPDEAFLDSQSFLAVLADPESSARAAAFSQWFEPNGRAKPDAESWAIYEAEPHWKLVGHGGREELYRIDLDPAEERPLDLGVPENASAYARLMERRARLLER